MERGASPAVVVSKLAMLGSERELALARALTLRVGGAELSNGMLGFELDIAFVDGTVMLDRLGLEKELWIGVEDDRSRSMEGTEEMPEGMTFPTPLREY